jgi:hypothetical protein
MGTNEPNETEAPGIRADSEEDEDVEGHGMASMGGDPDFGARMPSEGAANAGDDEEAAAPFRQ